MADYARECARFSLFATQQRVVPEPDQGSAAILASVKHAGIAGAAQDGTVAGQPERDDRRPPRHVHQHTRVPGGQVEKAHAAVQAGKDYAVAFRVVIQVVKSPRIWTER